MQPQVHLAALSSLLAHDPDAGRLHVRHLQLLALLCSSGDPVPVHAVAERLGLSQSQTSRVLIKLEDHGLIDRTKLRDDLRLCLAVPTAAGRALDARVRAHVETCRA